MQTKKMNFAKACLLPGIAVQVSKVAHGSFHMSIPCDNTFRGFWSLTHFLKTLSLL